MAYTNKNNFDEELLRRMNQQAGALPATGDNLRSQIQRRAETPALWGIQNGVNAGTNPNAAAPISRMPRNPQMPAVPTPKPGNVVTPAPNN